MKRSKILVELRVNEALRLRRILSRELERILRAKDSRKWGADYDAVILLMRKVSKQFDTALKAR